MLKTIEQVKQELEFFGMTISEWAEKHEYPYHTVRHVLSGQSKFTRGQAHEIAVLLGLKKGVINYRIEKEGSDNMQKILGK